MLAVLGGGKDRSGSADSVTRTTRLSQGGTVRALIIVSGEGRGALAAARDRASAGWTVGMKGPTRAAVPMQSRAVRHCHPAARDGMGASDTIWSARDPLAGLLTAGSLVSDATRSVVGRAPAPGRAHA
jgi:hypothetical protein